MTNSIDLTSGRSSFEGTWHPPYYRRGAGIGVLTGSLILGLSLPIFAQEAELGPELFVDKTESALAMEPADVRVLVWNVLHGANDVDHGPEKTLAIIRSVQPDIVLLQESYDINGDRPRLGEWLAGQLGWNHHQAQSAHLCILTPMKIEATFFHHEWHGVGALLLDPDQRKLFAWSTWIDYRSFPGYELRDNPTMSDETLLAAEDKRSSRLQQTKAIIAHLQEVGQLTANAPLLVGGDWNTPSHLDWTKDTESVYKNRRELALPVSISMHDAGFTDTFRTVYPNPVQHPGITWSPMFRGPISGEEGTTQSFDRIDRLYLKNPSHRSGGWSLRPVAGKVLPLLWEDEAIPIKQRTFPSDHGALLIDFEWVPPLKPAHQW